MRDHLHRAAVFFLSCFLLFYTACSCGAGDDDSDDVAVVDDAADDTDECIACQSTEGCTAALGAGWVCRGGCCIEFIAGDDSADDDADDDSIMDDTGGDDDDTSSTTTTVNSTTTTTTTSTSTTTSSTTTTTQPPIQLHATNIFNDAIDISVSVGEDEMLASLLGGWSFLTGRISGDWYETFDLEVTQDIPLSYSPDLSTPTYSVYTFNFEAFSGTVRKEQIGHNVYLDMDIEGAYGSESNLSDKIYGVTPPVAYPSDYPPMISGVELRERNCWTGEEGLPFGFDPDLNAWVIPPFAYTCVNIYFFHSDPDCDWSESQLYRYNQMGDIWDPVMQFYPDPENCSWFTSDGLGLMVSFIGVYHDLYAENEFRFVDDCGISSNVSVVRIYIYPVIYDSSASTAGRNAKLAEEVYYNDHGGDVSGGYTDSLSDLLVYDRNLTDDPEVTFSFGTCNITGYTFITHHLRGLYTFTWTD